MTETQSRSLERGRRRLHAGGAGARARRPSWSATPRAASAARPEIRWLTPALDALPESVERLEPPRAAARAGDVGGADGGRQRGAEAAARRARRRRGRPRLGRVSAWLRESGLRADGPAAGRRLRRRGAGRRRRRRLRDRRRARFRRRRRHDQHGRRRQGPGRHREDGQRGRQRHPPPRQRHASCRATGCSRPGSSATAKSKRSRRCSSPTAKVTPAPNSRTWTGSKW